MGQLSSFPKKKTQKNQNQKMMQETLKDLKQGQPVLHSHAMLGVN